MATPDIAQALETSFNVSVDQLTETEKSKLSKVLFPETHTDKITVLGKERILRPVPVKHSRKVSELLAPLTQKVEEAQKGEGTVSIDEEILKALLQVAEYLSKFYGEDWDDIYRAVKEEEISQIELEAIAFTQQELNGVNDFLLQPLRVLIRMLQIREIAAVKIESMLSTSISLPS